MSRLNDFDPLTNLDEVSLHEYEELLVRRDQLLKESGSYMTVYTAEFGDLIQENFELKIECIKKKKTISYCRRRMNRGLPIDTANMNDEIDKEMTLYYVQLKEMTDDIASAKKAESVGEYRFKRSKKIYRKLAKILHPDINSKTLENEELKDLWTRITNAYHSSDVDELDDLEVLVYKAIEELGEEGFEFDCSDLEDRIERVERQINEILTTEPYTYGDILNNDEKKAAHKDMLMEEHKDYEQYLESLTNTLNSMLQDGGTTIVWKMD